MLKDFGLWIIGAVALVIVIAVLNAGGLGIYKATGSAWENTRRGVYINSQAHVEGTNKHLARLAMDYEAAITDGHRAAIASMARSEAETLPPDLLSPTSRAFLARMENSR